jgi:glyoxylase-like metal-dependent hydrolase (beta-lactamase superfamily II)
MFSPLATTPIHGKNDGVLVDPPLSVDQAKAVGAWVAASGKKLTHIFVTHGHSDHWFTAGTPTKAVYSTCPLSAWSWPAT